MFGNHISPEISDYCDRMSHHEPSLLSELKKETYAKTEIPHMLVGQVEGRLLKMLVQLIGARYALEIGTFTGYSALSIAEGLPEDGRLITCDINENSTAIARKYFAQSPHSHKITLKMGYALDTIANLPDGIDFVFIDADKENYKNYYDAVLPKLRRGGLIVIDNCLWSGAVLHPSTKDPETLAIVQTNELASRDERVENVLLSVRDGINIIRKL